MPGSTTELALSTAVDSDDNADYLTISLANSLRTVDALFNNVTGHNHGAAHQGGPITSIPSGAIPDGSITSAKIADGTIATADLANAAVTNAKLASDTARLTLLVNGGLEIWQRGNGPFTGAGNGLGPDRWQIVADGTDTLSVSRDTANADGIGACAACTYTHGTGTLTRLQNVTSVTGEFANLAGRTVSMSMRVKCSTATAVRLGANLYTGSNNFVYSSYHSGGGQYETLTLTATLPTNCSYFQAGAFFTNNCTAYIDNAMLVVGSQAADYAPLHPADDLARCLRYYELCAAANGTHVATLQALSATTAAGSARFLARKAITPTVTPVGALILLNAGASSAGGTFATTGVYADGFSWSVTGAAGLVAGNATNVLSNAVNSGFIAEANP